jgi:hypothetical protein
MYRPAKPAPTTITSYEPVSSVGDGVGRGDRVSGLTGSLLFVVWLASDLDEWSLSDDLAGVH